MALDIKTTSKIIIAVCCFTIMVTQAACTQSSPAETKTEIAVEAPASFVVKHVDARGADALLKTSAETVVLDIRTPKEINRGHIEGAVFADFFQDDFAERVSKLDRDTPYLITCGSGGRSTKALTTLEELGFTNITHLDGGMKDWNKAELPVNQPR